MNIDDDVVNADRLRIVGAMRVIRAMHPELTDAEVRLIAEREQLASVRARVGQSSKRGV